MTAAAGFPTLRLVRYAIGDWNLQNISPGQWIEVEHLFDSSPEKSQLTNSHSDFRTRHRRKSKQSIQKKR